MVWAWDAKTGALRSVMNVIREKKQLYSRVTNDPALTPVARKHEEECTQIIFQYMKQLLAGTIAV